MKPIKAVLKNIVNSAYNNKDLYRNKKHEALSRIFPVLKTWNLHHGDYLEFGVYQGRAFIEAYNLAKELGYDDMHFYAFDSFEGLPEVRGQDAKYKHFHKGQYSCSEEEFISIIEAAGLDLNRTTTIKGFFDDSLTNELRLELLIKRAAIVWIDCDIYESTVPVLDFITDIITSGTFIAFDDWFSFGADPYAGEIRATREWLEKNKDITLEHYKDFGTSGRIFLVQKW